MWLGVFLGQLFGMLFVYGLLIVCLAPEAAGRLYKGNVTSFLETRDAEIERNIHQWLEGEASGKNLGSLLVFVSICWWFTPYFSVTLLFHISTHKKIRKLVAR